MKRVLKILGWTLFALVALVLDIVAVLHVPEGQEFVRFMVENKVGERFKGEVELGSLELDFSGSLSLGDLRFSSDGEELLHVERVRVELGGLPSSSHVDVALVEVAGVHIRQGEGLPRLETLFVPPDPEEKPPPLETELRVQTIRIADVNLEDFRPDGTLVKVHKLHLEGKVGLKDGQATFDFQLPAGESHAEIRRQDGATFKLPKLQLAFEGEANVADQALQVRLPSQKMPLFVQVPGLDSLEDAVALESLEAEVRPDRADLDLKGFKVADLTLDRFLAQFRLGPDRKLVGEQSVKLAGLTISRRIINQATGRESVDGPVRVDFEGRGPAEKVRISGKMLAANRVMNLTGLLNLTHPSRPTYEVNLAGSEVRTNDDATGEVHGTKDADFEVAVLGRGILPGETDATLTMKVKTARFGLPVDEMRITGKTDGNAVDLNIDVLDERMTLRAERNPDDNSFTMHLDSGSELTSLLGKLQKAGLFNPPPVPLLGEDLRVDIRATGELPDGSSLIPKVRVQGDVSAKGIRRGPNAIDFVSLNTNLAIIDGKPKGTVDLSLNGVVAGLIRFKTVSFRLALDGTAFVLDGSVVGPNDEKVASFRAHGGVDLPTKTVSATLDSLDVHHEAMRVSLAKPVTFSMPAGLELTKAPLVIPPIRLEVGDGWIDARGTLDFASERMDGDKHDVLVLKDSDLKLTLHRVAPNLPVTPKTRLMTKIKPRLSGQIRLQGRPDKPRATLNLTTDLGRFQVTSSGTLTDRLVKLQTELLPKRGKRLGRLQFEAPITLSKAQPLGPIAIDWSLERLPLAHFINLKRAGLGPDVHLRGEGSIKGTVDAPEGDWEIGLSGSAGSKVPAFAIRSSGEIRSRGGRIQVRMSNQKEIEEMPLLESSMNLRFARSPLTHPNTRVSGDFVLNPISISKLGSPDLGGSLSVAGSFEKRGRNLQAEAELQVQGVRHPKLARRVDVSGRLNLDKTGARLSGGVTSAGLELLRLSGGISGNIQRAARRKREGKLPLALTLETPRTSMDALRKLVPSLPDLEGAISGGMTVTGTLAEPRVDGLWDWGGFRVASGEQGRVEVALNGHAKGADLALRMGKDAGLELSANVTRTDDSKLRMTSRIQATKVRVDQLIPASVVPTTNDALGGVLDGEFSFGMEVDPPSQQVEVQKAAGSMRLDLKNLPIADTGRTFNHIHTTLFAEKDGLQVGPMTIVESDAQEPERRLTLTGKLFWDGFKPTHFKGDMSLRKWLGGGPLYAPHAQLDADIALSAVLDRDIPSVLVDFQSFQFEGPKRFLRDHYQEAFGENDVVYIDDERQIGKLPPSEIPFPFNIPAAGSGRPLQIPLPSLDVKLAFNKPARLNAVPLSILFTGAIDLTIRPDGVSGKGALRPSEGSLGLMGHPFKFERGAIAIDGPIIDGAANLTFKRAPNVLACRDARTKEGACEAVEATLNITPMGGIRLYFQGASGPFMVDAMALQNSGHARWMSGPGRSASSTVQFPQTDDYLIISWVMGNVAHLSGLDRYQAWSDPFSLDTYGQITSYEGQRLLSNGTQRLSLRGRPDEPGQNQIEVSYDLLFTKAGRSMFGLGFHLGDELHTGAELFYEWSSEK